MATLYFDEDKRRIYEVPDASSFILDVSGYRVYTPDDIPSAETEVITTTSSLWSRFVDHHNLEKWSTNAFDKTGGAFRFVDGSGNNVYAGFDLRLINQWLLVPANYKHVWLVTGNLYKELSLDEVFDTDIPDASGISPRIELSDSSQTTVVDTTAKALDYGGVLHYDENSANVGQEHPIGTSANPVNNLIDGIAIAIKYGLLSVVTFSDVTLIQDVQGFTVSSVIPNLTFYPNGFKAHLCKFTEMRLDGDFNDSLIKANDCNIIEALNVYGVIKDSFHSGRILIAADQNLNMTDCESGIPGFDSPIVDMNSGQPVTFSSRNFSGGQTIENCDTPSDIATLSFSDGGKPHIEPSCTDGLLSIRGIGTLDDRSNGTLVDDSAFLDAKDIIQIKHQAWLASSEAIKTQNAS